MSASNSSSLLPLPEKRATKSCPSPIGLGKLPRLITTTNTVTGIDLPRVTAITVDAQRLSISILPMSKAPEEPAAGVYQTLPSATRFAIIVPPFVSRAHVLFQPSDKQDTIPVTPTPICPRRNITVQRLGMQTPSPPWAVRHMLTRGGGRFSLMSLSDSHRPASERLAVQYVEGKGDVVTTVCLKLVRKEIHTRQTLDADLSSEQLKTFEHLVTERTRPHRLESMSPLQLAVHNNLARLITSSSRPGHQVRSTSIAKVSRSKGSQRMRRARPVLPPLDIDAARAYISTNPASDSPPESPGPATPADEAIGATRTCKEPRIAEDGAKILSRPSKKGAVHRVHSKGSKARLSRRLWGA